MDNSDLLVLLDSSQLLKDKACWPGLGLIIGSGVRSLGSRVEGLGLGFRVWGGECKASGLGGIGCLRNYSILSLKALKPSKHTNMT